MLIFSFIPKSRKVIVSPNLSLREYIHPMFSRLTYESLLVFHLLSSSDNYLPGFGRDNQRSRRLWFHWGSWIFVESTVVVVVNHVIMIFPPRICTVRTHAPNWLLLLPTPPNFLPSPNTANGAHDNIGVVRYWSMSVAPLTELSPFICIYDIETARYTRSVVK